MLQCDLSEFSFPAVLQMLMNGGRSGHLRLRGTLEGELWLEGGELVWAGSLGRLGSEALELFGSVSGGSLVFESGLSAPGRNLTLHRDALLRQLLIESTAWQSLSELFPDWHRVPRFTARWSERQPVTRPQYVVLSLVGGLSLRGMIERSAGTSARALLGVLAPFVQAGLVELMEPPPA